MAHAVFGRGQHLVRLIYDNSQYVPPEMGLEFTDYKTHVEETFPGGHLLSNMFELPGRKKEHHKQKQNIL